MEIVLVLIFFSAVVSFLVLKPILDRRRFFSDEVETGVEPRQSTSGPRTQPAQEDSRGTTRTAPSAASNEPPGSSFLIAANLILGWAIVTLGVIAAIVAAASCEEDNVFGESSQCGAELTIGYFLAVLVGSWALGAFFLWSAYMLTVVLAIDARIRDNHARDGQRH